ncbi:hypothetical protein SBDP1_610002 [Syntrophobacter sp. SbD1]|nr:hypothetical protein SBDP1_610002 [Syntrophobacter sp. SbD1]
MTHSKMLRLQIFFLAPLFFLPATDSIIHPAYEQWKNEKADACNSASRLVQYVAASERQLKDQTRLLFTALSKSAPIVREDPESCRSMFSEIVKDQQFFQNIGAADVKGDVFCDSAGSAGTNIAETEDFRQAVRTGRFVGGGQSLSRTSGKHSISLVYPFPGETGQPEGVIFASVDLNALAGIAENSLPEKGVLMIVDSKGTILARYPHVDEWLGRSMPDAPVIKAMLNQKEGFALEKDLDGSELKFAFTSVEAGSPGELHIAAGSPEKPFNWLSTDMLINAATLLGLFALYGYAAGWLAARFVPEEKV